MRTPETKIGPNCLLPAMTRNGPPAELLQLGLVKDDGGNSPRVTVLAWVAEEICHSPRSVRD